MAWLYENWLFLLLLAAALIFLLRRGGMACGLGGHGSHHDRRHGEPSPIDPVSQERVPGDSGFATFYGGRVYRFTSRENRDRFEAAPERFVAPHGEPQETASHGGAGCH